MTYLDYLFLVVYLILVTIVGVMFTRKEKNTEDYLLGGSKIPWWAAALSYMMSLISTISLVATPGEAYNNGLRFYVAEWLGPITTLICFHIFMRFYFSVKTFTPFTYLENRFDVRVRALISSFYFFSRLAVLALILFSCSKVFEGAANWKPWVTIIAIGILSTFYCVMGGLKAIVWTHVMQFFVLMGGLFAILIACIKNVDGGAIGVFKYAFENGRGFNFDSVESSFFSFDPHVRVTFWSLLMVSIMGSMFYNSADQVAIQQLLSTSSYKQARRSFITSIIVFIPVGALLWFIGLAMFSYFSQNPVAGGNPAGDIALLKFVALKMPLPLPGLILSAMLAAVISSVSAYVTSFATIATKDFYLRFFHPASSEQQQVKFSRIITVVIGLLGTLVSLGIVVTSSLLGETVLEASAIWVAIGAVVPAVFFIGVMNKRCNTTHALISIVIGLVVTAVMVAWYIISKKHGNPISFVLISLPGFVLAIISGMLMPLFFGHKPSDEKLKNLTYWTFDKEHMLDTVPVVNEPKKSKGAVLSK